MKRPAIHLRDRAGFDDATGVHHHDSICEAGQQSWIVRDENQRRPIGAIDIPQRIPNLDLEDHVETAWARPQ